MASSSNTNEATRSGLEPPDSMSIKPKGVGEDLENVVTLGEGDVLDPKQDADAAVLAANGHEAVMRRSFSWLAALGLGFSITNSWVGYLVSLFDRRE